MKNEVVFAAAGNGKTYKICKDAIKLALETNKCILLVTYTNEGVRSLENEFRKQNFGIIDKNVVIKTWYSFLLSELIKPYQCLLKLKYKHYRDDLNIKVPENFLKWIAFYQQENAPLYFASNHIQYYMNSSHDIRKDKVSHLAIQCMEHSDKKVINRLERIYSHVFFDELQDYAGWDLEIFKQLFASTLHVKCVGDYKQATFRTNNSQKNRRYRDDQIQCFFALQEQNGACNIKYENTTRRFNQEICNFVNTIHNDNSSKIFSENTNSDTEKENIGVFLIDNKYIEQYCLYYSPTILRYRCDSKISFNHKCKIFNYGNSKGATFKRTVIVPIKPVIDFVVNGKIISSKQTLAKFFVACTRAKHSVVFAIDFSVKSSLFQNVEINLGDNKIPAYKYTI